MAYEFERLSDVEAVEEFPEEGASVLFEHNGDIKKCPANGLGGGSGSIPVLLAIEDPESEEYIFELEDGRTADEFAASFEKDGVATALAIKSEEMPGVYMNYICHLYMIYDIGENEEMPQLAGGKAYVYSSSGMDVMLADIDMGEMVLLDHYIWGFAGS